MKRLPKNIVVAISGGGRTLGNLIDRSLAMGSYKVVGVISSNPNCAGNQIAVEASLPLLVADFTRTSKEVDEQCQAWLDKNPCEWILLAGFLKKFPLLRAFEGRIINIHPALLPRFGGPGMYGRRVHEAVLKAQATESGASVHFVNESYDDGALVAQVRVPVLSGDTCEILSQRVFQAECDLYPKTIDLLIRGILPLADGKPFVYDFG